MDSKDEQGKGKEKIDQPGVGSSSNQIDLTRQPTPGILISNQIPRPFKYTDACRRAAFCGDRSKEEIDNGHSEIAVTSTYASFDDQGDMMIETEDKTSDDRFIIGYHANGLPFIIGVDGFYGGETETTFAFVDNVVVPLVKRFNQQLSEENLEPEVITKKLIKTIYEELDKYEHGRSYPSFTLSLATVYQKNDQLYCSGFGVGDIGLIIEDKEGNITQLAHNTKIIDEVSEEGFNKLDKDSFTPSFARKNDVETIISRNNVFTVEVSEDSSILGYTSVLNELEEKHQQGKKIGGAVKFSLNKKKLTDKSSSLIDKVTHAVSSEFIIVRKKISEQARQNQKYRKFGDDCTLGSIKVPDKALQEKIQKIIYDQEKARLEGLLNNQNLIENQKNKIRTALDDLSENNPIAAKTLNFVTLHNKAIEFIKEMQRKRKSSIHLLKPSSTNRFKIGLTSFLVIGGSLATPGGAFLAIGIVATATGVGTIPGMMFIVIGGGALVLGVLWAITGALVFGNQNKKDDSNKIEQRNLQFFDKKSKVPSEPEIDDVNSDLCEQEFSFN